MESDRAKLSAIKAHFDDKLKIAEMTVKALPEDWQEPSRYGQLQQFGVKWLKSMNSPILKVPSAIVPVEYNYLLNPEHPELKLKLEPAIKFKANARKRSGLASQDTGRTLCVPVFAPQRRWHIRAV